MVNKNIRLYRPQRLAARWGKAAEFPKPPTSARLAVR
jgi:hypothetical protein